MSLPPRTLYDYPLKGTVTWCCCAGGRRVVFTIPFFGLTFAEASDFLKQENPEKENGLFCEWPDGQMM
jgi:hypothetical protein